MECCRCNKEKKRGVVNNGVFMCQECVALEKKSAWELRVKERFDSIGKLYERIQSMYHTLQYDMEAFHTELKEHGIDVERWIDKPPLVTRK